ncbi:pyruvate-formate lyase [Anaerotaenia torta]|uniref:pyruvate formate lyase family protein n=1 Tax=Anaerotaenia torta TaxID=433293 RepID=UPI003D1C5CFD
MLSFYEYLTSFTKTYQEHESSHKAIREAECLKVMSKYQFIPMEQEDLLAGRKRVVEVGFSNEPLLGRSVGYFYDEVRSEEAWIREGCTPEQIGEMKELLEFWKTQETRYRLRQAFPEYMKQALPEDIYWMHSQIAFPLYRVVGAYLDYDKLLALGLGGLKEEIRGYRRAAEASGQKAELYMAMEMALDTLSSVCIQYAKEAEQAGRTQLAEILNKIASQAPETFVEAMQLVWLYALISGVLNYGRMDSYLGEFLVRDYELGRITEEEALRYVQSLWKLIADRNTVFHGRVIIGGKGRKQENAADAFALLAIEASRTVKEIEPQLSLRFYEGQNPLLLEKAYQCISEGRTYPMLYHDEVNIPAVQQAFGVPEEEAVEYMMFGCGEYVINKKSIGSPNGIINLLKALEVTMFNGYDIRDEKDMGLKLGSLTDFETFEEFYRAYQKQLTYYIEILGEQQKLEYDFVAETAPLLYISILFDNCLERGKGVLEGGAKYLGGTLETYGNINTSNSLYAIKEVVYEKKLISRDTLLKAIKADFEGYEKERDILLKAEKYGNDLEGVDSLAVDFHNFLCNKVKEQKDRIGLHSYLVVIINNEANTILGGFTGASADGRRSGEPMANANNPAGGTDQNGLTAMLNSLTKLDTHIHAGAVQNMTLSRELFTQHEDILKCILKTYFTKGGQQAMISVLNRHDLENAMKEPEKYGHLMVRVGGFSARFVTLSPNVQKEIASRTLY